MIFVFIYMCMYTYVYMCVIIYIFFLGAWGSQLSLPKAVPFVSLPSHWSRTPGWDIPHDFPLLYSIARGYVALISRSFQFRAWVLFCAFWIELKFPHSSLGARKFSLKGRNQRQKVDISLVPGLSLLHPSPCFRWSLVHFGGNRVTLQNGDTVILCYTATKMLPFRHYYLPILPQTFLDTASF